MNYQRIRYCANTVTFCATVKHLICNMNIEELREYCLSLSNGEWHVIHSTWSFIRPMDMDFVSAKQIV